MALKLHHCAVDGMASVHISRRCTTFLNARAHKAMTCGPAHSLDRGLTRARDQRGAAAVAGGKVTRFECTQGSGRGLVGPAGKLVTVSCPRRRCSVASFPPKTRFNQRCRRPVSSSTMSTIVADFNGQATVPVSTINDVALAYVRKNTSQYLDGHGELPDESLVAACPISLRDTGVRAARGRVVRPVQTLGTAIAEPLERLGAIGRTPRKPSESDQSI